MLVVVGNQIEGKSGGSNGEFSLTTLEPALSEVGTYEAISLLGFKDEIDPQYRCQAGDATITLPSTPSNVSGYIHYDR